LQEEEELGGEQKRANTNPDFKPFSMHKLSPFNKRKTISPSEVRK